MGVSVVGLEYDNVDGLAASLAATFKTHRENGDVILNLEDASRARAAGLPGPKKLDPRPAYVRQPFPKHIYHADGRERVVADPAALAAAKVHGFREAPYPKVRVAVGDPGAEKAALQLKLAEADGKIATQNELLLNMADRLTALEQNATEPAEPAKKGKQ